MNGSTKRHYSFADFEIDAARRVLNRNGEPVALKSKAFDLLLTLVERQGEILSKDELLSKVWDGQFVEEGNLTVHISALRKALGEKKQDHHFIVTVPGRGYSFVGELNDDEEVLVESHRLSRVVLEEEVSENETAETIPAIDASALGARWGEPRFLYFAIASVIILTAAATLYLQRGRWLGGSVPFQQMSMRRLTSRGTVGNTTISPDGKLFAFAEHVGDEESLWLGHVEGGDPVQLRAPAAVVYLGLRFTPDNNTVYYTISENYGPGTLYRMPVFGGAPEKVRDNFRTLTFSPDGREYAFIRDENGVSVLVISEVASANERDVATSSVNTGNRWFAPAWSPDGKSIAVFGNHLDGEATIFRVDAENGSVRQLTPKIWHSLASMTWLRDGRGLITVGVDQNAIADQLWDVAADGTVRRLTNDLSSYSFVSSTSSGMLLVAEGRNQSNIWLAPSESLSSARQITFGSIGEDDGWSGMAWSPDGRIIYSIDTDSGTNIWSMDPDGKNKTQLTPNGGINNYPSMTADGKYLVFQSNRGGHWAVWRLRLSDDEMKQLTGDQTAGEPFVSPDGKWIVYETAADGLGELWRMTIDGVETTRLMDGVAQWPQISPDSRLVACGGQINGVDKLAVLPIEGGKPLRTFDLPRLFNFRWGIKWAPDRKALTYRDWGNGIWRQNVEGGGPERLNGLPQEKLAAFAWSSDGRRLAFSRVVGPRDVVLIRDQSN